MEITDQCETCLLYTSDAADERSSVDLGGRRIIKKKTNELLTENGLYIGDRSIILTRWRDLRTKETRKKEIITLI